MGTAEWQRSHSQLPLCMSRWVTRTDRNVQLWCDNAEAKTCLGSQDVCDVPKQSPALAWSVIRFAGFWWFRVPRLTKAPTMTMIMMAVPILMVRWCWLEAELQCWRREWQWKVICECWWHVTMDAALRAIGRKWIQTPTIWAHYISGRVWLPAATG